MRINYRLGKNMRHALRFIAKCNGWHTYAKDESTVNAIHKLESLGIVETNEYKMFRVTWKGLLVRAQMDAV